MIQVQIASQITAQGVEQPRWVLVDPAEAPADASPPLPAAAAAPLPASPWPLRLVQAALLLAGLLVAVLAARLEFGVADGPAPGARPVAAPAAAPAPAAPVLRPAQPASAAGGAAELRT